MRYPVILVACCGALMSCIGKDRDPDAAPPPPPSANTTLERYNTTNTGNAFAGRNEVISIAYDAAAETLVIQGDPFDLAGTFVRAAASDVAGFTAFQNDGGARTYTALIRTDLVNDLTAGVVGTPVKLNNEFGGTVLRRGAVPDLPVNREIRHTGDYAGLRNVGVNDGADMSNSFLQRVEGRVALDLDFFQDRGSPGIEGVISNRRNLDDGNQALPDIVLEFNIIDSEGNFSGVADGGVLGGGSYDGMIAGPGAAASAGIVVIGTGNQIERGAFTARIPD